LHPDSKEAHQYQVGRAVRDKKYFAALAVLLDMKKNHDRFDIVTQNNLELASQVADLSARVLADHDVEALRKVDAFAAALLSPSPQPASLQLTFLQFGLATDSEDYQAELRRHRFRLYSLRAELATRLGEDSRATDLVKQASHECADCITVVTQRAINLAVTGQYERARAVLDEVEGHVPSAPLETIRDHVEKASAAHDRALTTSGPPQLQARASELAALELWGRAFDVLAPYQAQIERAPGVAAGFAELAFRAGEPEVAREVMIANGGASKVTEAFAEWTERMGWTR
jgi:hypothetical protein